MPVTKTDISTNKPTLSQLIQVANGEDVLAETENANNLLALQAIITAYNWIIDSGVELSGTNIFTAVQQFAAGLKAGQIDPLTTNGNIIANVGTGNFYQNTAASGNEYQTLTQVNTLISSLVGANIDLVYGGIQTGNFNAVSNTLYFTNTTSSAFTGTLPLNPTAGDVIGFIDIKGRWNTNNFTIGRNTRNIMDLAENLICNVQYGKAYIMYDATNGWYLV